MLRTHTCGDLTVEEIGKKVTLAGWVHTIRTHGNVTFIDVKDRYGVTQLACKDLEHVPKKGFVVQAFGVVQKRPDANKQLATGEIEVKCEKVVVLNQSKTLPMDMDDVSNVTDETRLKYRYLDLRRDEMQHNLQMRHRVVLEVRNALDKEGFVEIETPVLAKSTPEGARDYLVPSRVNKGMFYALPQSPQIFKQLCMISGFDKYMQIVRCYRDEDLRADRQPEFTQIDVEMSFIEQDDLFTVMENMFASVFKSSLNVKLKTPFPRLTYDEAIERYGLDKPDIRFGMELQDITEWGKKSGLRMLEAESVKCIVVSEVFDKKQIKRFEEVVKVYKAPGLAYLTFDGEVTGSIAKPLGDKAAELQRLVKVKKGTVFILAGKSDMVNTALGYLRNELGKPLDKDDFAFCWVTDFPMFEFDEGENRWQAMHHPFTGVMKKHRDYLKTGELEKVYSTAYDLVLNGVEIGSGSIRTHSPEEQRLVFEALKLSKKEIEERFGFLISALEYGAPPMGGVAFGLDRLIALMTGNESIREVIAFPKNKDAVDVMMGSPSSVDKEQLSELGLKQL